MEMKVQEARGIENSGHTHHAIFGKARHFLHNVNHRIQRVRDDDDEGVRRVGFDALGHLLYDFGVRADQVVPGHARLPRNTGRDDDDVRAGDVLVIVRAADSGVAAFDRRRLMDVETFALRHSFHDVEQNDVSEFFLSGQEGHGAADLAGSDQCDFFSCHV